MFKLEEGQHGLNDVWVMDEAGAGGAHHHYEICAAGDRANCHEVIRFQDGPVKEAGANGIFIEDLLQICRHRLQCFQAGEFACRENEMALAKIEEALHWLDCRTRDRQRRNVEGTDRQ